MLRFLPLQPFWQKMIDWDSSEILFLEGNVPPLPLSILCNLTYNRPSIFVVHFSKTSITWSHLLGPGPAHTAERTKPPSWTQPG